MEKNTNDTEIDHEQDGVNGPTGDRGKELDGNGDEREPEIMAEVPEDGVEEQLSKEKDRYLRLFAEFENYKRRTTKERMELYKTAGQEIMLALLPVMDDFDRALKEIAKTEDDEAIRGVSLIREKLRETLNLKGLREIEVVPGADFDPEVHDAITRIPAPNPALKGKIADVVEKGYSLGDKIIIHPKVVVGN